MCNKAVNICPDTLEFVSKRYKNETMFDTDVDTYPSTIKFVLECLMTQEMCDKAVDRCFLYLILFVVGINLNEGVTELFLKMLFHCILSW